MIRELDLVMVRQGHVRLSSIRAAALEKLSLSVGRFHNLSEDRIVIVLTSSFQLRWLLIEVDTRHDSSILFHQGSLLLLLGKPFI